MSVSVNWLRELVPGLDVSADEIAERLSLTAVAVDAVVPVGEGLEAIRVARVLEARPHPNADRLTLCRVDAGGDPVEVVCGAPVVEEGALYPYVGPGGTLPGGLEITEREIRGEVSAGMLCSEKELGVGQDAGGILELPPDLAPGTPLSEAMELPDARLELDLTPNRVDLACHVGVARELAADTGGEIALRAVEGPGWEPAWTDDREGASAGGVTARIDAPERCRRYLGAVVRGVSVGPSPAWLARRLRAIGARPVNNVVDATNYVLHELNQPIHAFDLGTLRDAEIRVRAAEEGEGLVTLDGRERELSPAATVIADARDPVGLAGVMGGRDSEVGPETTDLFIECALFDPGHTRATARSVELATDASYRFERGIDPAGLETALARCVELILATAGGEASPEAVRLGEPAPDREQVVLRPARVRQVLGIDPDGEELRAMLEPLGFESLDGVPSENGAGEADGSAEADRDGTLNFGVPGWRGDVTREIDLVEEVARRHGYEEFPAEARAFRPTTVPPDPASARAARVRRLLAARGLLEARSSSLVSDREADPEAPVRLLNPLSAEEAHLRGALVPVLLRRLEHNFARGTRDVRLFEIGTVFWREGSGAAGDGAGARAGAERSDGAGGGSQIAPGGYAEELRVAAVLTGRRRPEHWSAKTPDLDVWDLKGLAEEVGRELCDAGLAPDASGASGRLARAAAGWTGAETFRLARGDATVGVAGRVRPEAVDAPPWAGPVWALELPLAAVRERPTETYRTLSSFPPLRRDLAFTVPEGLRAEEARATILRAAPEVLEELRLFDVYEGEEIEAGRRSLAYHFRFRARERTLEDEEVDAAMERIVSALEEDCDASIRSS